MNKIVNVAILGYGTVGRGIKEILDEQPDSFRLLSVLDLPQKKAELGDLLCSDVSALVADERLDVVFECLGGDSFAYQAISSFLRKSVSVITSNKEVVSKHLYEFLSLAEQNHCYFLFEASVGGGIPLIKPLMEENKFDEVTSFQGILNGTCNYILTKVFLEGMEAKEALKKAQENGFAEANPHADLSGEDLKRKGIILANLCFHKQVRYEDVPAFGIERLSPAVIAYLQERGWILKMMVKAKKEEGRTSLLVEPTIFPKDSIYAYVQNEFNLLEVEEKFHGKLSFIGKGAGKSPTAAAMVEDLMAWQDGGIRIHLDEEALPLSFLEGKYLVEDSQGVHETVIKSSEEAKNYAFLAKIERR